MTGKELVMVFSLMFLTFVFILVLLAPSHREGVWEAQQFEKLHQLNPNLTTHESVEKIVKTMEEKNDQK